MIGDSGVGCWQFFNQGLCLTKLLRKVQKLISCLVSLIIIWISHTTSPSEKKKNKQFINLLCRNKILDLGKNYL